MINQIIPYLTLETLRASVELTAAEAHCKGIETLSHCDMPRLVDSLRDLLETSGSGVCESTWLPMLLFLSEEISSQKLFTYPDVLLLALCELIAANGVNSFQSLSVSLEIIDSRSSAGELSLSFVHRFGAHSTATAARKQRWLNETLPSLQSVLRGVGGVLRVPLFTAASQIELQLTLPFSLRDAPVVSPNKPLAVLKDHESSVRSDTTHAASEFDDTPFGSPFANVEASLKRSQWVSWRSKVCPLFAAPRSHRELSVQSLLRWFHPRGQRVQPAVSMF